MKQLLHLSFIIIIFASCQQTSQKLRLAEEIIETQPDSALKILREIDYQNEKSDRNKALYGLLLFKALDKNDLDLKPDSLINFSIKYYEKINKKNRLVEALFYKGRLYYYAINYDKASEYYIAALENLYNNRNYGLIARIYADLGYINFMQSELSIARKRFEKAIIIFQKAGDSTNAYSVSMDIGNTYRYEKNFVKAQEIYFKVLKNSKDSILSGAVTQEIGINYFEQNKFDSAILYLRRSIKYPHKDYYNSVRLFRLADTYFELAKYDSATYFAKMSLEFPGNVYTHRECYRVLINSAYIKEEKDSMAKYLLKYQNMTDTISSLETQTKATVIEDIYNSKKVVRQKNTQIAWIIIIISFIICIGTFLVYKYFRRNKLITEQKKVIETSLNAQKNEKEQNKTMLRESMKDLIEKNKALKSNGKKNADIMLSDETVLEIYNQALQINNYEAFSQKINAAYNNMICELTIKFPAISQKEMLYCSFILLDIPQNHAMVLLETTSNGLYKIRQRLAQKLELSSTRELDDFLKNTYGQ
jgi:tetratricopeptide (TPR) repeat protein